MSRRVPYYETAQRVFDVMIEQADDDGLWSGRLSHVVADVTGGSVSAYSQIVSILRNAGAIEQVKRGGGSSASIWQIVNPDARLDQASTRPSPLNARQNIGRRLTELERKLEEHLRDHHAEAAED